MANNITKWTGSILSIKQSAIKNHLHYQGHISSWYDDSACSMVGRYTTYFNGAPTEDSLFFYKLTTTTDNAEIVNSLLQDIDIQTFGETTTNITTYLKSAPVFKGASGSYTSSAYYTPACYVNVKQSNYITSIAATEIWVGDTTTAQWTDRQNAFDKKCTITSTSQGISLPATTTGITNSMIITGTTGGLSTSIASTTNTITIVPADGSTTTLTDGRSTTQTITVKNPVNEVSANTDLIELTTSNSDDDTHGSVVIIPTFTNSNGFKVYDNTGTLGGAAAEVDYDSELTSGTEVTITAKTKNTTYEGPLQIISNDGSGKSSSYTIALKTFTPTFESYYINVGEAVEFNTIVDGLNSSSITVTSVDALETSTGNVVIATDHLTVTGAKAGDVFVKWNTSDNGEYTMGKIIVAAGIQMAIVADSTQTQSCSTANYGDTVAVYLSGGKTGAKYTITLTGGATFEDGQVTKANVEAGDGHHYTIILPVSGADTTTITATLTGTGTMPTPATCTLSNITFTLS